MTPKPTDCRSASRRQTGSRRRFVRGVGTLAAIGALTFACSGCLGSGYAFFGHQNPDHTEMYFKLPTSWKTFNSDQIIEAANGKLSKSQLKQVEQGQWWMYFASSQKVKLKSIGASFNSTVPEGATFAQQLSAPDRDAFSLQAMRAIFLGVDPLTSSSSKYNVLDYTEFNWPGGIRGSRLTVDITGANHRVSTENQVVAVDPSTNWAFGIEMSCRVSCYGPNTSVVNQIIKSWTVKELAG